MPNYNFVNTLTKEEFTSFMSWAEREQMLADHPELQPLPSSAAIVSGVGGFKTNHEFRSLLKKISKDHPRNNMNF